MANAILLRAWPYRCTHRLLKVPYWTHRSYLVEIVGHGWTQAPSMHTVIPWALDWLINHGEGPRTEREVIVEWN